MRLYFPVRQAREKIKPEFFTVLNEKVVRFFYDNYEKEGLVRKWKGRLLWAVDEPTGLINI